VWPEVAIEAVAAAVAAAAAAAATAKAFAAVIGEVMAVVVIKAEVWHTECLARTEWRSLAEL